VFKKLFGSKESPKKNGKSTHLSSVNQLKWRKVFWVELSNMEGTPKYKLTHQLSVGSEVGNVIISDPTISPRHCSLILQDEVISILDHGSVAGTFVNGKKIVPGKYILLEESDSILAGELELKIATTSEPVEVEEEMLEEEIIEDDIPEVPIPLEEDEVVVEEEVEAFDEEEEEYEERKEKSLINIIRTRFIRPKNEIVLSGNDSLAANTLVRVFAIGLDILLANIISIVLGPYDDFKSLMNETIPQIFAELNLKEIFGVILEEQPILVEIFNDVLNFGKEFFDIGTILLTFILIRIFSTLILGVSVGELLIGMRSKGNFIWNRIGGVLRVLLGLITGPLIIFDLPAIVSRRTFKEFMTFTHLTSPSKVMNVFGIIIFFPLFTLLLLVAPMIQGFDVPEKIQVNELVDKRKKVVQDSEDINLKRIVSEQLNLSLSYNEANVEVFPDIMYSGKRKKINILPSIYLYEKSLKNGAQIKHVKNFDFKALLNIGLKHNPFLMERYANLYQFSHSTQDADKKFKNSNVKLISKAFGEEFIQLTKLSMELDWENLVYTMSEVTPIISGLVNFKASLLEVIEDKDIDVVDFVELGDTTFLRLTYMKQNPYDLLIPLIPTQGRVFKVEYHSLSEVKAFKDQLYKFMLDKSDWLSSVQDTDSEANAFSVFDFYSQFDTMKVDENKAQEVFAYYFENSSRLLNNEDAELKTQWLMVLSNAIVLFENSLKSSNGENPVLDKMYQNLKDVRDAFENSNGTFFGIESTYTL